MDDAIQKSSTGLDGNVAGALCYALGWVSGIIFLIVEKDSRFVRFHAMQSIIVYAIISVLYWVLGWLPGIVWLFLAPIVGLAAFGLWIFLIIKAYQGQMVKLPIAGDIAMKQVDR